MNSDTRLNKAEIEQQLEVISTAIRARMDEASPTMIGLLPTESDWATPEERARIHELKLQLPSFGEEAAAARARLKLKRQQRLLKHAKSPVHP